MVMHDKGLSPPLIELRGVRKSYGGRDDAPSVEILHGIDLDIHAGEFIALMGASGSGKSTLMHILGCLDRASAGTYRFAGQDIASFTDDERARLRRETFGFVFQGYHLIRLLDAAHNVQMPAVYAGTSIEERQERAQALLERLDLGERGGYRPDQLSGGQQQRVSIARALMNGAHVILADEPTGALDSRSGAEVMALLRELADTGHTIILVTHDPGVAAQARRVVRISDGRIVDDSGLAECQRMPSHDAARFMTPMAQGGGRNASWLSDVRESLTSAWRTLWASRFRTLLTLLGIVIGVASVIVLMAVGQGSSEQTIRQVNAEGKANRLAVRGEQADSRNRPGVLTQADAQVASAVPNVEAAVPMHKPQVLVRAGGREYQTEMWAGTPELLQVFNGTVAHGVFFNAQDELRAAAVVVLGSKVYEKLFGGATEGADAVGAHVWVDRVPFQVIGVMASWGNDDYDDCIYVPFSSGSRRLVGDLGTGLIQVKIRSIEQAEETVARLAAALEAARGRRDFVVNSAVGYIQAAREVATQQALLMALIAGISLVVGGIGIMNIMLMAVRERTREIGIRMATGARQRDIQRQFLTEAVMVALMGGAAGVVIGLSIGVALIWWDVPVIFSIRAMLLAFACAVATGLVFGFMPARQAARLDPVVALAGEGG